MTKTKTITLADIAEKAGVNPKTARAKLRALPKKERPKTVGDGWVFPVTARASVERVIAAH